MPFITISNNLTILKGQDLLSPRINVRSINYVWFLSSITAQMGFPGGSDSKESACSLVDLSSILGLEDPLEEGMATHSSILAWRIPMDRGAWWVTFQRVAKSQTWLSDFAHRAHGTDTSKEVQYIIGNITEHTQVSEYTQVFLCSQLSGGNFLRKSSQQCFPLQKLTKQNKKHRSPSAAKESESVKTNFFLLLLKS